MRAGPFRKDYMDTLTELATPTVTIVGEVEAGRSSKVRAQLEELVANLTKSNFDIAVLLHEVRKNKYHYGWGYGSFKEYTDTLKLKSAKVQYLVRMIEVMTDLDINIPRAVYEPVGISKLREITSLEVRGAYLNPETGKSEPLADHIIDLTKRGTDMTLGEIRDIVKRLKGLEGDEDLVWMNIRVKKAVLDATIKPAIELAKKVIGSTGRDADGLAIDPSDGQALECITANFLLDPNNHAIADGMLTMVSEEE